MIILGREVNASEEQVLGFAINKGYKPTNTVDITEEMTVIDAADRLLHINKILEDTTMCIATTGTEEVGNTQTAIQYIESLYYAPIILDIKEFLKSEARKGIEETRRLEDEAIEKQIEEATNQII